jgi:carbamoyltransferase
MDILGISAFYHDSAACLVRDGAIVAAAQEERFTRVKHDSGFPARAVEYCLRAGGISPAEIDYVAFYDKPLLKFERLLETWLAVAPRGFRAFIAALPIWLRQKLHTPRQIDRGLGGAAGRNGQYKGRYVFPEHHESHAAAAFFPSPFEQAAFLTVDGVGEWATASLGVGRANRIELSHELRFPHSLGLLYSAFTYFCGFRVNSGEYKLMGLAPFGQPRYRDVILDKLIDLKDDGSFRMDMRYFNYCSGMTMTSRAFERLFAGPPRKPEAPLTTREMDLAASIQAVTEEIMLRMARHVAAETKMKDLVLAGGVALNCVANGRILREGIFDRLWIQPAAGDAGGALGAAMFVWHQLLDKPRHADGVHDGQRGSLLGPAFSADEAREFLTGVGAKFHIRADEDALLDEIARAIEAGMVVGHFHGPMEFGPRAMGNRSILADARNPKMQSLLNRKIKFRESFRPFAPSVLAEDARQWFDLPDGVESPYMLLTAPVRDAAAPADKPGDGVVLRQPSIDGCHASVLGSMSPVPGQDMLPKTEAWHPIHRIIADKALAARGEQASQADDDIVARLLSAAAAAGSAIPAVTHVDGSARVQTVDAQRHGRFHRLLQCFRDRTGCGLVINTSFNVRGEPIVCSPADAWRCFLATNMDVLVLEDCIAYKADQPAAETFDVNEHLARFAPD